MSLVNLFARRSLLHVTQNFQLSRLAQNVSVCRHFYNSGVPIAPGVSTRQWKDEVRSWKKVIHRYLNESIYRTQTQKPPENQEKEKSDKKAENETQPDTPWPPNMTPMIVLFIIMMLMSSFSQTADQSQTQTFVSWTEFVHQLLAKGEVAHIVVNPDTEVAVIYLHSNAVVKGQTVNRKAFLLKIASAPQFEEKLRKVETEIGVRAEDRVPVTYERSSNFSTILLLGLLALMLFFLFRGAKVQMGGPMDMMSQWTKAKFTIVDPHLPSIHKQVTFKDVAGMDEAKQEVMEFVDYLKNPKRYTDLGAKIPRGALLLGPPGCGKTMLAKAVATESGVPFLTMAGSEFIEMIGGVGAARVRDLFKEAKKRAPCIIYLDEIDAIGKKRNDQPGSTGESEQTLNQLLVEMDGMESTRAVIMLASTNRPDVLDKALLRPGRFDRHITIDSPNLLERKDIFEVHLKRLALQDEPSKIAAKLAPVSPGMSGADIANVCNEAALFAARNNQTKIEMKDFDYAIERIIAGVSKKSNTLSEQERKIIAYHECGHAVTGWLLKHTDALLKVSIVPRTHQTLGFAQYMPSDQKLHSKDELLDRMCMALGGRVAESLTFNRVTTGARDDLKKVTRMAYAQIRSLGMSDRIGLVSFPDSAESGGSGKRPYSKRLSAMIDEEVRFMVAHAYKRTEKLLQENKGKLKLVAEELLKKEVLQYDDFVRLLGPPPYGIKKKVADLEWIDTNDTKTQSAGS